jgi:hypothetical protein
MTAHDQTPAPSVTEVIGREGRVVPRMSGPTFVLGAAAPVFAVAAVLVLIVFSLREQITSPVLFVIPLAAVGMMLAWVLAFASDKRALAKLFVVVFAYNITIAVLLYVLLDAKYGVPYFIGGTDDEIFHNAGLILFQRRALGFAAAAEQLTGVTSYIGYPLTVGWIYAVGDGLGAAHSVLPRLFNAFAGSVVAVLVYRLARDMAFNSRIAFGAAYLAGLYPFLAFHNALILRDTLVAVFVLATLCAYLELQPTPRGVIKAAIMLGSLLVLYYYRDASAALLALTLCVIASWSLLRRNALMRAVVITGVIVLGVVLSSELAAWYTRGVRYQTLYMEFMGYRAGSGSIGILLLGLPFPFDLLARMVVGLMWPLPVLAADPAQGFMNLGALLWYPLLPFIIGGWVRAFGNTATRPVAITSLTLFLGVALVTLAYRHMTQYVPMLLIFGVAEFSRRSRHQLLLFGVGALGASVAGGIYMVLKFG